MSSADLWRVSASAGLSQRKLRTRFDRTHFKGFGDSSLDFEVVYFVFDPDYNRYMDIQQVINLELVRRFAAAEIDFAFPTRTVHVETPPARTGEAGGG